ncbi:MAG: rhamnogalacturonan lyase [Pontiellaceae bacterium]|nr:rhamnogalacturonan lyase [Pontiellaceae bacterium]
MKKIKLLCALVVAAGCWSSAAPLRKMEYLNRGVVAIRSENQVYVSWRLLATDPDNTVFEVYRRLPNQEPVKLTRTPITKTTDFTDTHPGTLPEGTRYYVVPVSGGKRINAEWAALPAKDQPYLSIALEAPGPGYSANDCSAADLDGDGEYEIVLKWDPRNSQDNSRSGKTDNVFLDAYKLDGTRLWRIDLGPNIRAGAHYTQFMVYDLDSDGFAELVCKTADGTIDGKGKVIGDKSAVWRNERGYILAGPEFLTCFDGRTGAEISTVDYVPPRHPDTERPSGSQLKALWGDNYGNRCDRFLACVAYLDGEHPSVVMCRGYYTRAVLAAWDLKDGKLRQRWVFDSEKEGREWRGQGNHGLIVADVDGDGKDEITYGAMCVDDDGKGLYNTRMGHGDAAHMTDLDPERPGQEVWTCQEDRPYGAALRDAQTGEIIFRWKGSKDTGRCCAADIDPRYPGYELWASGGCALYDAKGNIITERYSLPVNFVVNWDGDDLLELLDGTKISQYNWETGKSEPLLDAAQYDCASNNGTKATPCLSADLFGDYREEVVWRTKDSSELRIFTTTIPAGRRLITLMQDPQYRLAVAWQNVAYNQPPHPSFYMGDGMKTPPRPKIEVLPPAE